MPSTTAPPRLPELRPSGYASRLYELGYGVINPFYDPIVWWGMLPLGGLARARRTFAGWCELAPGQRVVSLCCGTGSTERAMLAREPDLRIIGIDLGRSQLAIARRRTVSERIDYRLGNASATGLPGASFDRVAIVLALHEMPRELRLAVLREAGRLCRPDGRVVAIEHARPQARTQRWLQYLWWFFWLPGNPETATSRDLQSYGLAAEARAAGLVVRAERRTRPDWLEAVVATPAA